MTDPILKIIEIIPREFFRALQENLDAAFVRADALATKNFAEPERLAMRGQHRHALCEDALRSAATGAGISAVAAYTEPAGARFSLITHQGISLIRSNIQVHCGTPRPTRFRKQFAAMNAWLRPVQTDLFRTFQPPPTDKLCGIIVATINRHGDQTLPAFVGLGVPFPDLSGWLAFEPIHKVMARYQGFDAEQDVGLGPVVKVIDKAMPKLKRKNDQPDE
jgi:hypothetical protein